MALEVAADLPGHVLAGPLRQRQIVGNLLGNAVRFTDMGLITVRPAHTADGWMALAVGHTGPGNAPDRHATVLRPFEQAHDRLAQSHGGTGLGLSITRRLVGLLDGALGLNSAPDRGSRSTVTLPFVETDGGSTNRPARPVS